MCAQERMRQYQILSFACCAERGIGPTRMIFISKRKNCLSTLVVKFCKQLLNVLIGNETFCMNIQ